MRILGISAYYHDSAAALIEDGRIVAAAAEERFSRTRHDAVFPERAVRRCLETAGWTAADVDIVVFYEKPLLKFERLLSNFLRHAPRGLRAFVTAMPVWLREKLLQRRELALSLAAIDPDVDWHPKLRFSEHHLSHAASAFYPSPFARAAVVTIDGVGEWATTTIGVGEGSSVRILEELHFPHSLGLLYSAFTYHLGFRVNSGEYKVMGLAPYGRPIFAERILERMVTLAEDGSFTLDPRYFAFETELVMTTAAFGELLEGARRAPDEPLTRYHADVAASLQSVTETIVMRIAQHAKAVTGMSHLCLAGGVALNGVANGVLKRSGLFADVWVQPASGDAGGAVGAALAYAHLVGGVERPDPGPSGADGMQGAYLGPGYSDDEVARRLEGLGARVERFESDAAMLDATVDALARGETVGWFQGRMEFGPRALGARSILADPRVAEMRERLNRDVKHREGFRPFAPAVPLEDAPAWFELDGAGAYMQFVVPVAASEQRRAPESAPPLFTGERPTLTSTIPAVTHVDGSARVQTVDARTNPRFHALLRAWGARTGCPVLVNTSYNLRGEPIVESPEDAFRCLMESGLDLAVMGRTIVRRAAQDPAQRTGYSAALVSD